MRNEIARKLRLGPRIHTFSFIGNTFIFAPFAITQLLFLYYNTYYLIVSWDLISLLYGKPHETDVFKCNDLDLTSRKYEFNIILEKKKKIRQEKVAERMKITLLVSKKKRKKKTIFGNRRIQQKTAKKNHLLRV